MKTHVHTGNRNTINGNSHSKEHVDLNQIQ